METIKKNDGNKLILASCSHDYDMRVYEIDLFESDDDDDDYNIIPLE